MGWRRKKRITKIIPVLLFFLGCILYSQTDTNNRLLSLSEEPKLQILVLGGSTARGHSLPSPSSAYPHLLQATNLALNWTSPVYPALCIDSILQNSHYEVIIIDYFFQRRDVAEVLAKRLRGRFPEATVVFLGLWNPFMMIGTDGERFADVRTWAGLHGLHGNTPSLLPIFNEDEYKWDFIDEFKQYSQALHSLASSLNGQVITWDNQDSLSAEEILRSTASFFSEDWYHLSPEGHNHVAERIRSLLSDISPTAPTPRPLEDFCVTWHENGECPLTTTPGITMETYTQQKHALRFPPWGGSITIHNPFPTPRKLVLSYLITERPIYPKIQVDIHPTSAPILIDPIYKETKFPIHAVRSTVVGMVDPGENVVSIKSTEKQKAPFRVVGVGIVGEEWQGLQAGVHFGR